MKALFSCPGSRDWLYPLNVCAASGNLLFAGGKILNARDFRQYRERSPDTALLTDDPEAARRILGVTTDEPGIMLLTPENLERARQSHVQARGDAAARAVPKGQLWQPCRKAGCRTEPVSLCCEHCDRHCSCEADARQRAELQAIAPGLQAKIAEYDDLAARGIE